MIRCVKCKVRIKSHLWLYREDAYCSASCQRGKASQFEKVFKALEKMRQESKHK